EVKSKRREVHMEILSEQVKSDIENSRLIVANPTHITIGIYFNAELVAALTRLCETEQLNYRIMHSGAGHDAQIFAPRVPTCMI
ncbi:EscU/YscU/HrcU family type III secretion system export apparatus switch protein, partial [Salmonella enterica subsp. enterica serovar Kentucky]|nr:EscU/YscU/HrcU family type III secretion system export apparatus switch protein [Salmonella enterica subsp. enterica serovar Kentucky]